MANNTTLWWSVAAVLLTVAAAHAQSSSPLTVQPSTNRVGINTSTPTATLDVNGTVNAVTFRGDGSQLTNLPLAGGPWTTSGTTIFNGNTGNVGVGTATPATRLHVNGGTTTLESPGVDWTPGKPLRLDAGGNALAVDLDWHSASALRATTRLRANGSSPSSEWSHYWYLQNPWGALRPEMRLTYNALYVAGSVYAGGVPDIAENIWVSDPTIGPGDVVAIDRGEPRKHHPTIYDRLTVRKASGRYDPDVLGVISSGAGLLLHADPNGVEHGQASQAGQQPLALAGRIPVRVSLENGPIEAGDRIVASSLPGLGMRASQAGMSVGIAAEAFDGADGDELKTGAPHATGTILMFVNLVPVGTAARGRGKAGVDDDAIGSAAAVDPARAAVSARGRAQLKAGEAVITLSDALMRAARGGRAVVQLTPAGGWSPLFVAEAGQNGSLIVRTTAGGDPTQAFFWEIRVGAETSAPMALDADRGRP